MRGEQNNILFPVRISWAYHFPNLSPFAPPLGLEVLRTAPAIAPKLAAMKNILNLKNHATNNNSCTGTDGIKQSAVPAVLLSFVVPFAVKRTPLKPSIKFIFNGVIKAFYLSDRREL